MKLAEAFSLLRMPDDVHFEFEIQQNALPVAKKFFQMLCKYIDSGVEVGRCGQLFDDSFLVPRNVFFKDCEEYVLFIPKIIVESTSGLPSSCCDVFDASGLEAVAGEDFPGCLHEVL